jgi:type VI secretion system FHA domain protein
MKIAVVSMRSGSGAVGLSAEFGPAGGTIGRAKTNSLVLDDPDRTVSRVHAQVLCRNGVFYIVDQGSNPLQCNGAVLGAGNETQLAEGDRLQVGGFELVVSQIAAASGDAGILGDFTFTAGTNVKPLSGASPSAMSADDPFADLLAGLTPVAAPAAANAPAAKTSNAPAAPSFFPDPMGLDKPASSAGKADPFDDLLNFGGAAPGAAPGANPMDGLGIAPGGSSSIDDLFDLSVAKSGKDPFAASPLGSPMMQPNTASSADPFAALMGGPKATAASHSDHVPVLQQAYSPPKAMDAFDVKTMAPQPAPRPPPPPLEPPPVMAPVKAAPVNAPAAFAPPAVARPAPPPVATPKPAYSANQASDSELLAAFLRGVKSTHQMPTELTPALMELIGGMLHTAAHGTLQLLISRQEFKRGVRSDVTMISVEANNPLKFSPTADVALAHMLGPKVKGFMGAEEAMHNAYADLRAHQLAVMVGMRAALAHVLERFTPEKLESRLTEKSALDALFAANRKAKLWDQFCQLYTSIASEAEDDFHTLFGQAFTKAYDEQMARFKSGR